MLESTGYAESTHDYVWYSVYKESQIVDIWGPFN